MIREKYSIEEIQNMIIQVCETLYGKSEDNQYFCVPNSNVEHVKTEILQNLEDEEIHKMKYLDIAVYILQTGEDVFINII